MKCSYRIFLIALFLFAGTCAEAGSDLKPAVRATVDRRSIYIGDRIECKIEVSSPKDVEVKFPKFADDRIGIFEIKDSGSATRKGFFANETIVSWYRISAYAVGKEQIPPIEIKYKRKTDKDWSVIKTSPIEITVASVLPRGAAAADIRDIKGPFRFFEINWILVAAVIAALFLGAAVLAVYKKVKQKLSIKLPHETALEELEAIKNAYAKFGDVKEYYVGISDCVRRYIERVFRLKAPEMTTEEFLNFLRDSNALKPEQKDLLKEFLNACDLVKFAKYAPTRFEVDAVFMTAKKFIEETKVGTDVHL